MIPCGVAVRVGAHERAATAGRIYSARLHRRARMLALIDQYGRHP